MTVVLRFATPATATPGPVALRFGANDAPQATEGTLAAQLPAPSLPLALAATGDTYVPAVVIPGTLAAALPPAALSLSLAATLSIRATEGTFAAALPAPTLSLSLTAVGNSVQPGALAATLPPPVLSPLGFAGSASITIDLDLPDADGPRAGLAHHAGIAVAAGLALAQQEMRAAPTPGHAPHAHAAQLVGGTRVQQQQMLPAERPATQRHAHGERLAAVLRPRHADHERTRRHAATRHAHGLPRAAGTHPRHAERIRLRRRVQQRHTYALPTTTRGAAPSHHGQPTAARNRVPHAQALPLPVGFWQGTVLPPPEPPNPPIPYGSPVHLIFWRINDGTHRLRFGNRPPAEPPAGTVVIPIREVYLVINSFALVRADTGESVDVQDFSASLDVDSWCWGWSASLPASLMPLVRSPALGEHVELIATLNGTPLRLVVERLGRDRRFGSAMLRISGRGRAAWLADPHSPIATRYNSAARTAQQLLADALMVNGVSIGWTLDWRIADWLVPAGAWSHTGTYMDAATRLAEAGGGYAQAHDTDQTLIVLPRYPSAPWEWAAQTPDIELPEDVCEVEGIEWQDKPAYNAVWVTGGEAGRRDRIRRAGTAADRTAPTIVDPLATAPEMTRARGLAVLADTGRQAHISLRLPVLPETGIIRPGKLVRYQEGGNTHLGLTRAVQLEQRFPDLWQTIRIETHELEPV
ncbi:MAG: hypothetical protein ROZ37_21225 [Aromatoleum sp.]|uniref:hypothetical protein n=1 Tax=Aromatoleum sp. TaxID=2307007 RepID=UPI00289557B1|nr:hypothetical protein [Aromatoleum sp.]MDT3672848.1 hypothetical protein [Aromatoleum sp.]